ncbi:carboxyl transferase domain-containing protein [Saccharomonospora sp. NPDC006951]
MPEPARALIGEVTTAFAAFTAFVAPVAGDGPIHWPGYDAALARARSRTGEDESVVCGLGKVGETEAVLIAFEFGFLGGSIGGGTGTLLRAAFGKARELGVPVVSLIATGGSRMQEGMRALSQLQYIAAEMALTRAAGLAQVAVLCGPATGGGWATLGAGADVTLALPGAQVGFAGSRVRPGGDDEAYTAEGQFARGHVDQVVGEGELRGTLERWLRVLTTPASAVPPPAALGEATVPSTGWAAVTAARARARPRAASYVDHYFDWWQEIRGDRCGGVDRGVLCGFGLRDGAAAAFAAQCGTPTRPAGFRTAARLVRLADRLRVPVLTLIDTPGAANDGEAERAGAGPAIAELFSAVAAATVPMTSLVIGEGGSGGALAFAAAGRLWATPDSFFSVTSPEAAAAILKRGEDEIAATADQLRLRPQDLVELGIARGIVGPER